MLNKEWNSTIEGVIHTTLSGFYIRLEADRYFISNNYVNEIYLTNWKNREKVLSFCEMKEVQLEDDYYAMQLLVAKFFGRTNQMFYKRLVALAEEEKQNNKCVA